MEPLSFPSIFLVRKIVHSCIRVGVLMDINCIQEYGTKEKASIRPYKLSLLCVCFFLDFIYLSSSLWHDEQVSSVHSLIETFYLK